LKGFGKVFLKYKGYYKYIVKKGTFINKRAPWLSIMTGIIINKLKIDSRMEYD